MTRNLKIIIIMAAGILLLVGALVALSCDSCAEGDVILSPSDTEVVTPTDSGVVSELSGMHLHHNDSGELLAGGDQLESLRLISNAGDYLITRKADGELTIESLSGLLLETDFLELAWYNALSFGYSYTMHPQEEGSIDLAAYGLDPAKLTVECKYTDGSFCRLFIGNEVTGSPTIYYFQMEGRDEVFLSEFDASFFQGDTYWLSDDIFGDDVEEVSIGTIRLTGSAFPQETVLLPHQSTDKSDPYYGSNYVFTEPFNGRADDYLVRLLTDELTELVADEAVCAFPTDEQLTEYGLDKPFAVITHQRNGQQKILRLAMYDPSTMYAKADGIDCVYMLSADAFPMLAALSPDLLRAPEIHVRYFDAVESIRITTADEDYLFRLKRTPLETDNSLYEYRAFYGDTQLTLNYYKNLLEIFNSATSISYDGQKGSEDPAVTVTISYFQELEREEEIIRYFPAGPRRYAVEIDGDVGMVIGQMWVDQLLNGARQLAANQAVTP